MRTPAYQRDAYLTELETTVTAIDDSGGRTWVVLADTVLYPEGGGQPADHGTIAGCRVVDVQKVDGEIRHLIDGDIDEKRVRVVLDWERRWDHMQQHTAQHVLTAVALRDFSWRTTAFHMGTTTSDIELDVAKLEGRDLERLEDAVMHEVRAARPVSCRTAEVEQFDELGVRSRRLPEGFSGPVRLVDIEGLDLNTCGGTHVRNTTEIGVLCLLGTESMRGGTRLHFVAGDRVRRRMRGHERRTARLRSLLDSSDDDLPEIVALRIEREKNLARVNRVLANEAAAAAAASLAASGERLTTAHWDGRDMAFVQAVARRFAELAPAGCALLTAEEEGGASFVVVAGPDSGVNPAVVGPQVADALGGRGGGKAPIFQGKTESLANRRRALEMLGEK